MFRRLAQIEQQLGSRLFERSREIELAAPSMSPAESESAARELAALRDASMSALDELLRPAEQPSVS